MILATHYRPAVLFIITLGFFFFVTDANACKFTRGLWDIIDERAILDRMYREADKDKEAGGDSGEAFMIFNQVLYHKFTFWHVRSGDSCDCMKYGPARGQWERVPYNLTPSQERCFPQYYEKLTKGDAISANLSSGNLTKARSIALELTEEYPDYPGGVVWLAVVEAKMGNREKSLRLSERAYEMNPKHALATAGLAVHYYSLGRTGEARELVIKANAIEPNAEFERSAEMGYLETALGVQYGDIDP